MRLGEHPPKSDHRTGHSPGHKIASGEFMSSGRSQPPLEIQAIQTNGILRIRTVAAQYSGGAESVWKMVMVSPQGF